MTKVLPIALFAANAFAATFTGVVTDEHCGAKHAAATSADQDCVAKCIKNGTGAALLADGKIYKIENQGAIKGHEGRKVTVSGTLKGDTLRVDSVGT